MSLVSLAGRLIAYWRKRAGLSQAELARRIDVTPQAVGQWENGATTPTEANVARAADACGLTMKRFYAAADRAA